jgi:hypothetical protein
MRVVNGVDKQKKSPSSADFSPSKNLKNDLLNSRDA